MADGRWWSILVILVAPAAGAAEESWVGRTVFVKREGVTFGYVENGKWVNAGEVAEVAVPVLEERGDWVLIRSGGKRGWVNVAEVVPVAGAIEFFTGRIESQPGNPALYLRRSAVWVERGEYEKAARDCTQAIRLDPARSAGYYGRAVARHLGKQYEKALSDYSAAILLAPDHAGAHAGRAWLRATCPDARYRDGAAAVRDARQACELARWASSHCLDSLAAAHAEDGQFDEAVRWQEKALQIPGWRGTSRDAALARVKLYRSKKPYRAEGNH
jgi:tetratricopeptide (TPR) repeat protein